MRAGPDGGRAGAARRPRALAAMSGGVDSGVAAALLAERGFDVTGVTLKLFCYGSTPVGERACCSLEAIEDARRVAGAMGFAHHVAEAGEAFRARVVQPFLDDYVAGRTPYPCALCNRHLKFGELLARADLAGADVLCTGHYARLERRSEGTPVLRRARDAAKDQSYALALVPPAALARAEFPLGGLVKDEVRAHARRLGLAVWDRPESQDLCFVPDGDYAAVMRERLGEARGAAPGPIVDPSGRVLGAHRGIVHYTVGQRRGLGLAAAQPLYVLRVDAAANTVTVGPRGALESPGLVTGTVNWLVSPAPGAPFRAEAKIRARHAPAAATVVPAGDGGVEVRFDAPQLAVTPGQLCVLYDGDRVLGGAPIAHALPGRAAGGGRSAAAGPGPGPPAPGVAP